jgi:hypothetical protein
MSENELRPGRPVTIDNYDPFQSIELRFWSGGGIDIPKHTDLAPKQVYKFKVNVWTGRQVVALATLVHQDYPGTTVQWQAILSGESKNAIVVQERANEQAKYLPNELLNYLYEKIKPEISQAMHRTFPAKFTADGLPLPLM